MIDSESYICSESGRGRDMREKSTKNWFGRREAAKIFSREIVAQLILVPKILKMD